MIKQRPHILIDLCLIGTSVIVAILASHFGLISRLLDLLGSTHALEGLVVGLFFTSAFTTAFSIVAIAKLALGASAFWIAFFGAVGATLGDILLLSFIKSRLAVDIKAMIGKSLRHKIIHIIHSRLFRWFSPFVGALIIASPLPDEFGLALFGLSNLQRNYFILFAYLANFVGILIIALVAQAL